MVPFYTWPKTCAVADTTLDKFMAIFGVMANSPRHLADVGTSFPASYHRLKSVLKIDPDQCQKVIYICPSTTTGRRRLGEFDKVGERCGWRLRVMNDKDVFVCDSCKSEWPKKHLDRDGNHFITVPIRKILQNTMDRFGKYTPPLPVFAPGEVPPVARDVTDGERFRDMILATSDLALLLHSDGAAISRSTSKKLYLIFMQCVNIPLHIRMPLWTLQSVWVGNDLVKDRECFLTEITRQLKVIIISRNSNVSWNMLKKLSIRINDYR